nr:riboflavin synthase [Chitinophagaceae bacterium]
MFTGIIEAEGKIQEVISENGTLVLHIESEIASELKVDQSVAHNGICLTVIAVNPPFHTVCAVQETIEKTSISSWKANELINLERCMKLNDRLDGHLVQGHVDTKAVCIQRMEAPNNWTFRFQIPEKFALLVIEKGSVCVNGTSLTCFNVSKDTFDVAIIPYTFAHTTIRFVKEHDEVNIEFDVIGKYISRMKQVS